jgi:hypothetical protein
MSEPTNFDELCEIEPALRELETLVRSQRDDGTGSFYCSNYVWLPLNAQLKFLLGVARPGVSRADSGDRRYSSRLYELAYVHLSQFMPPCRDCGCRKFWPLLRAQLGDGPEDMPGGSALDPLPKGSEASTST